jgi:hypothetical protein
VISSLPFQRLRGLEDRASDLDQLAAGAQDTEAIAAISAKRRFLLLDLQAEGLFDADMDESDPALALFPMLRSYTRAALKLRAYYASEARRQYLDELPPKSLIIGPISVDWFRFEQPIPAGFAQDEWLAHCEYTFRNIELGQGGGEIFFRAGDYWCTLLWRYDDGIHPVFFQASISRGFR